MTLRIAIALAAFILPPALIGIVATFSQLSSVMIARAPEMKNLELPTGGVEGVRPPALSPGKDRLKAAILISNEGTQLTDLLGTAEVLGRSGRFDLFTVAPERRPSATTGAVAVLPHYSFATAPKADLIVVPAVLDSRNPKLVDWLAAESRGTRLTLVVCEGARLAARARILDHRYATSHFMALDDLERSHPDTHWLRDRRYVIDHNVITTGGVTASIDGALFAIEALFGRQEAEKTAKDMALSWNREARVDPQSAPADVASGAGHSETGLRGTDFLQILLRGGYDWFRGGAGVLLYPGMSDLSVAAPLDTLPRTQSFYLFTVAQNRTPIRTRAGIDLIPTDSALTAPPAEVLFVPSRDLPTPASGSAEDPLAAPDVRKWIIESGVIVKSAIPENPGSAFPRALQFLADTQGAAITGFVARMIDYRSPEGMPEGNSPSWNAGASPAWNGGASPAWPTRLLVRPLLLGLASMGLAFLLEQRIRRARADKKSS